MFIDTHTHLYLDAFDNDRSTAVKRALDAGITKMILPDIDSTNTDKLQALCQAFPQNCYPCAGLHPTSVKENWEKEIEMVKNNLVNNKCYGIGETGIDLYWDKSYFEEQKQAFKVQINLAKKYHLPIIIHARDSFPEIFDIMDKHWSPDLKGVFHCFTGSFAEAQHIAEYKTFKMGIGGVVTFKKAGLDKVLENVPLTQLVLETDSPFLAPTPYRGKRNESAYIINIARKLADVYNININELAQATTHNASELFKL